MFLRQSTASQSRLIGPFIDNTDFITPLTALTIANTDIKLRANGTTLSNKNSGGGTHQANGEYSVTWDATDTANVGELRYDVSVSGALSVFGTYFVLEEAVYDALFAASAPGYVDGATVNATKIGGTTQTGRDLGASVLLSSGTGTGQVKLASGYIAPNWGDVGNPTTAVGLTGTTIATSQVVATVTNKVTPIDVDGVTHESAMTAIMAALLGVASVAGATVTFYKRDGTTGKVEVTVDTSGVRLTSTFI